MFFWHTKPEIEKYHKNAQMTCQNGSMNRFSYEFSTEF